MSSCLCCNALYLLASTYLLPSPSPFSQLSAFIFFPFFFPIIMRDICLQTASEVSSAPAYPSLLLPTPTLSPPSVLWILALLWEVTTSQRLHLGPHSHQLGWDPRKEQREEYWPRMRYGPAWAEDVPCHSGWLPGWEWAHAGLPLSVPAAWPRYRVVGSADAGQYNLEITDAELSDDASYECQATEAALRSRRAKLTVLSNSPQPLSMLSAHSSRLFLSAF